jgi:hypothetical protein
MGVGRRINRFKKKNLFITHFQEQDQKKKIDGTYMLGTLKLDPVIHSYTELQGGQVELLENSLFSLRNVSEELNSSLIQESYII